MDTTPHEVTGLFWEGSPVEVEKRWRFLAARETDEGFEVTGAWSITLHNTSGDVWKANLSHLTFEDSQDFQIAEYYLGETRWLQGHETAELQDNFKIPVASIELANSINEMSVWASFVISN